MVSFRLTVIRGASKCQDSEVALQRPSHDGDGPAVGSRRWHRVNRASQVRTLPWAPRHSAEGQVGRSELWGLRLSVARSRGPEVDCRSRRGRPGRPRLRPCSWLPTGVLRRSPRSSRCSHRVVPRRFRSRVGMHSTPAPARGACPAANDMKQQHNGHRSIVGGGGPWRGAPVVSHRPRVRGERSVRVRSPGWLRGDVPGGVGPKGPGPRGVEGTG